MLKQHYQGWEANGLLVTTFHPPLEVLVLGYGWIYKILCGKTSNKIQYEVTIGNFSVCTCMDFVIIILSSLGK